MVSKLFDRMPHCKPPAGGGHFAALLPSTQPRLRAEQEGEEGREEQEEVDSKPRDPMFGKWIQAQASLHKSVEESFSEQVLDSRSHPSPGHPLLLLVVLLLRLRLPPPVSDCLGGGRVQEGPE